MTTEFDSKRTNCVVYARSATDDQNSIEIQIKKCTDYAQHRGLTIVGEYSDNATSGSTVSGRSGLRLLLTEARKSPLPFWNVVAVDISRLSRNLVELSTLIDTLHTKNIQIHFVAEG